MSRTFLREGDAALSVKQEPESVVVSARQGSGKRTIVIRRESRALAGQASDAAATTVTAERRQELIAAEKPAKSVVLAGVRGRPGPRGEPGPAGGAAVLRTAGATVSALQAVYERDGLVYPLDYRDEDSVSLLLGIALTAAGTGGEVTVQRSGALTDSSWTWSYGPLWLGAAGAITQTPPDDGFDVAIGVATAATSILLDIQPPIELE